MHIILQQISVSVSVQPIETSVCHGFFFWPHMYVNFYLFQELRSREEELTRAALQQKSQEELLKRREQQLAEREINVLERELNILIFQLNKDKPNVKKRKGKFKRSRLKLKDGNRISLPSGEWTGQ